MIEQFTDEELELIAKELEDRKRMSKSRTKHAACADEIATVKKWLAQKEGAKVCGWSFIRSTIFCYCDMVTGNYKLERLLLDGEPFINIIRPKDILESVDIEKYKKTLLDISETIIESLQKQLEFTPKE